MSLLRYASSDYPANDRVAVMLDVYAAIERVDVTLLDNEPPDGACSVRLLPNVAIMNTVSGANTISRRTRRHVDDGKDDFVLCIVTGGELAFSRNGAELETYATGEAYLGRADRPSEHRLPKDVRYLDIVLPRSLLAPAARDAETASRSKLPRTPELDLLRLYAEALTGDVGDLSAETSACSATHVFDLVVKAVGGTRDANEMADGRGVRAARLKVLKADIRANVARPELSLDFLAARHGLSPQYMRSLFNSEGTTFSDIVLEGRLCLARRLLADRFRPDRRISEVAFEVGFNDLSYFNRTFRRRFGMTPSDARAADETPRPSRP